MRWQLILEEFWPNIQHISGVDNIVSDTISIFSSTSIDNYEPSTRKDQCCANELFAINRAEKNKDFSTKYLECAKRKTKRN